jgi:hypothetical protein
VIALQTFFELGFNILIVNQCSHEWSRLSLSDDGRFTGDKVARSRLVSFGRLLFRWYGVTSLLFLLAAMTGGSAFLALAHEPAANVAWKGPWAATAVTSALLLWTLPFNAVLEGCNQVAAVYRFRLIQAVVASLSVWIVMAVGGGLWAAAAASAARLGCDLFLLLVWYRRFFDSFWSRPAGAFVDWSTEIWPIQWRLAVGAVFGYFAYFFFVPVMVWHHGLVVAGQMGMTWTVVTAVQAAALAWVQTRAPLFGVLVSQHERAELDRVFFRVSALGVGAYFAAAGPFWVLVWLLNIWYQPVANRLLGPAATAAFLAAALVQIVTSSLAFYVRAHKREPFLWVGVVSNVAIGIAVWLLGGRFGPLGAGLGLLGCHLFLTLPTHVVLWRQCRAAFSSPGRAAPRRC